MTIYNDNNNKKKKKSKPKKQLKSNVWDWINEQAELSTWNKARVLELAKSDDKDRIKKESGIKPENIWINNFIRYPKNFKKILLHNHNRFTFGEYILLDYFLMYCYSYNTWIVWYALHDILQLCSMNKKTFYNSWRKLENKNIIKLHNLTKDEQHIHNIYRKSCVLINPFWDTWTMDLKDDITKDDDTEKMTDVEDINKLIEDL